MSLPTRQSRLNEKFITPQAVHSPPYTYGSSKNWGRYGQDEFRLHDIVWATPEDLVNRIRKGDLAPDRSPPAKKWLLTQLNLYGIPYKKSDRAGDLKAALVKASEDGKCIDLAPSIAAVRDRLQNQYNEAFERLEDKLFEEIGDHPSREAYYDERRFVAKYFQDSQRRPDRSKNPEALCIASGPSWGGHQQRLKEVVEAVPGLAIHLTEDKAVVGWAGTIHRAIENEFSRLEDYHRRHATRWTLDPQAHYQSHQANLSLEIFLAKTLGINKDGKIPLKGKRPSTPILLAEPDLHNRYLPGAIVSKSPGLLLERYESIAIIGWDSKNIKAEINRLKKVSKDIAEQKKLEEEQERAREKAEQNARLNRRYKPYRNLVARQGQPPNPWGIQHLIGSYIVHWHGKKPRHYGNLNDPYSDTDVMTIDVFPCESSHGVRASFWFGLFEGVMLLAKSKQQLERLRDEQPKGRSSDGDNSDLESFYECFGRGEDVESECNTGEDSEEEQVDDQYDTGEDSEEEQEVDDEDDKPRLIKTGFGTFYGSRKAVFGDQNRKSKSVSAPAEDGVKINKEPVTGQKRAIGDISDHWGAEAGRLKRQMTGRKSGQHAKPVEEFNPNRIYFQFVAKSIDGYPKVDFHNENLGHLDFDETRLAAKGQFVWPCFWGKDKPQFISIYKVSERPKRKYEPTEWYMYDGRSWAGW